MFSPTKRRFVNGRALFFALCLGLMAGYSTAWGESADDAMFRFGAIQRIADSYLSPLADPPDLPTDMNRLLTLAQTGDIIIENNLAFPQIYAVYGTLVPGLQYVHAQIVISGEDLDRELRRIELLAGRSTLLKTMRVRTRRIKTALGPRDVNVWEP